MNENKLDELLQLDEYNEDKRLIKKINKQMNKQIYKRTVIVIIILAIILTGGYYGTSFILDQLNYNPIQENDLVVINNDNEDSYDGFHILMGTFVNMYFPGELYLGNSCKGTGFGQYEIKAKIQEIFQPLYIDGVSNVTFQIQRSNLKYDSEDNGAFSRVANEYYDENQSDSYKEYFKNQWQFDKQDIEELPDSTILDVSLSFSHTYTLEKVIEFMKQYPDSNFIWIATQVNNQIAEGMSLYDAAIYDLSAEAKKKYPTFYLESYDYTADILKENYLSKLKLLKDHKEFVQLLQKGGFDINVDQLNQRYNYVKKNGIHAIGIRGYIKKKDFIKMCESNEFYYEYIHDIKLSYLQK